MMVSGDDLSFFQPFQIAFSGSSQPNPPAYTLYWMLLNYFYRRSWFSSNSNSKENPTSCKYTTIFHILWDKKLNYITLIDYIFNLSPLMKEEFDYEIIKIKIWILVKSIIESNWKYLFILSELWVVNFSMI